MYAELTNKNNYYAYIGKFTFMTSMILNGFFCGNDMVFVRKLSGKLKWNHSFKKNGSLVSKVLFNRLNYPERDLDFNIAVNYIFNNYYIQIMTNYNC